MFQPAFRRAAERMAPDEAEPRRKPAGSVNHGALRAPNVGDDGGLPQVVVEHREQFDVLPDGRREDHEIRLGEHDGIVRRDVDRMQPHRALEDVFVVDADDERRGPDLASRQLNRSAAQPESDYAYSLEDWYLGWTAIQCAWLDDW